jgi:SAM-dependent methyltransferase
MIDLVPVRRLLARRPSQLAGIVPAATAEHGDDIENAVTADEEVHNRRYAEAINAARTEGEDAFQNWFDRSSSIEESLRRGYWDFAVHILTPSVVRRIADPGSLTALEIGYGGGRLLNAAAAFFGRVVGVDVHEETDAVAALLRACGHENVELLRTDGRSIPLSDASVDVVYSFIVLQHVPSLGVFRRYVDEAHRVLRPGGVAQLYFGRLTGKNPLRRVREIPDAPVNHVSLEVSPRYAARVCRRVGFAIVDRGVSYKNLPDGYTGAAGGQSYVTVVKHRGNAKTPAHGFVAASTDDE